jgi:hypothetical protein
MTRELDDKQLRISCAFSPFFQILGCDVIFFLLRLLSRVWSMTPPNFWSSCII